MRQTRLVAAKTTGEDVPIDFTASGGTTTSLGSSAAAGSGVIVTSMSSTDAVNALRLKKTQIWARLTGFPHWPGTNPTSNPNHQPY
jgi:hypothetical protein